MKSILFLITAAVLLTGCSIYKIDSVDSTLDFYPPKNSINDVQYLEKVDTPFVQIGVVTVTAERRQSLDEIIPKLKQEAAILGGDVITDIQTDASGSWQAVKDIELLKNAYIRAQFSAKVLVLK